VYNNLVITGLSIAVALLVGTIEIAGILSDKLNLHGGFWDLTANFNLNEAGYIVVAFFITVWFAAVAYWKLARIETRWTTPAIDQAD
jgi:high-affinity nickel-transport protein